MIVSHYYAELDAWRGAGNEVSRRLRADPSLREQSILYALDQMKTGEQVVAKLSAHRWITQLYRWLLLHMSMYVATLLHVYCTDDACTPHDACIYVVCMLQ